MKFQIPFWLRFFENDIIWRRKTLSKVIYLTFDDGPVPEVTPQILDILDRYGWKATFFCVGQNVKYNQDLFMEIVNRGHRVGNHTYSHLKGFSNNTSDYVKNVLRATEYIKSTLFRPPYGKLTYKQYKALKKEYQVVMWDVITYDYDGKLSPDKVFRNVTRNLREGSVVVFHDSLKAKNNVLNVLPRAIEFWIENGYRYELF